MKAMVLAAGLGSRMRPLTLQLPKPELPVMGRPMILQTLARLKRHGYDEAVVNLHHLADRLRDTIESARGPALPDVAYSFEPEILGTAGGLRAAADRLRGSGPILVTNADYLADIDLAGLRAAHRASGLPATLVVSDPRAGYGTVDVDERGLVRALAGAPDVAPTLTTRPRLFTGCHMIDEALLDSIPDGRPSDIVSEIYRPLAAAGKLGSVEHAGHWCEMGTPGSYLDCALGLLGLAPELLRELCPDADPVRDLGDGRASVGAGVRIQPGARTTGRSMLGFACHLAEDVECIDSIVMREAWLGTGARLERVIVGPGAEVPAGFRATGALLATAAGAPPDAALPDGVRRDGPLLIADLAADAVR